MELAREPGYRKLVSPRVRTMIEIVGTTADHSEEVVVAALQWAEIWQVAEMPFADQRGAIARLLQHRRQSGVAWRQANVLGAYWTNWFFQPNRQTSRIASSDQRRARRRAVGGIGVTLRESQSLDCQPVDVWRCIVAVTVATHISVAEVIRQDEDDVRLCRLSGGRVTKPHPRQRQRTRGSRLDKSTTRNCALLRHGHPRIKL